MPFEALMVGPGENGGLVEIRPGRKIWVEVATASASGSLHGTKTMALLVHGSCARLEQVRLL